MSVVSVFLFALAISIDAFSLAVGFGIKGLYFSFIDCIFVNVINSLSLFISILLSRTIFMNNSLDEVVMIGCCFLIFLGLYNIINYFLDKKFKSINFNKKTSSDTINRISVLFLMCIESVVSGFSMLAYTGSVILLVILAFILHTMFLFLGLFWGKNIANSSGEDVSWLSGILFVLLAVMKFFG